MPEPIKDQKQLLAVEKWVEVARKEAEKSKCLKSKVGVVIVKNGKLISSGHNKVTITDGTLVDPKGYCKPCIREDIHDNSHVERCYAIHAEQMALIGAHETVAGATMYHVKLKGGKQMPIKAPTCTVCNRMLKETGVYFVTLQKEGYVRYSPEEVNLIAFKSLLTPSEGN